MPSEGHSVSGVVAVLTYRRQAELRELLGLLQHELGVFQRGGRWIAIEQVLVIDNDPGCSGRAVAAEFSSIRYVSEPTPGIAAARNRALDEASTEDLLIFIDDDERPGHHWLDHHLDAWTRFGAVAVAGAVVSKFEGSLDPWIAAGGFFDRRRPITGTVLSVAATNNLLLDLREVRRLDVRFDQRFGLTGGEDTLFTRTLVAAGALLIFCNEAVVFDHVPAARMTRRWVLSRYFSSGNSWALTGMEVQATGGSRAAEFCRLAAGGSARVVAGGLRCLLGTAIGSRRLSATGLRTLARGLGLLMGASGFRYREYRRTPE